MGTAQANTSYTGCLLYYSCFFTHVTELADRNMEMETRYQESSAGKFIQGI